MSIKKMLLLASLALAVVAFVAPATASALEWKHEGKKLAANANISFTGPVGFNTSSGSVSCETAHGGGTISPGEKGTINSFDGTNCKGGGDLAGCTVVHDTALGLPWSVHISGSKSFAIKGMKINTVFTGVFCPVKATTLEGEVYASLDNAAAISSGNLSGSVSSSMGTWTVNGTLQFTPAKTYGIG